MKKIELKGIDLEVSYDKLEDGLEVFFIPMPYKNNYFMTYATKYGSAITEFTDPVTKKMVKVPDGIAHFLEHKMFEQEDGIEPFAFFAKSGTGANASTEYDYTQYICFGTSNLEKNLDYLISFVDHPYFTDKNVLKEKGIISEEIKMYDDMPECVLDNLIRESLLKEDTHRIKIGGTIEEINKITKEDLYLCYKNFYRKDNMFLIVAGNIENVETLKDIVKKYQHKKQKLLPKIKDYKEPDEINIPYKEIKMNIILPKIALAIKANKKDFGIKEEEILDMYLNIFNSLLFGYSSDFRDTLRNKHLVTSFYTEWQNSPKHKLLLIEAETDKKEELIDTIKTALKHIKLDKDDFERTKKVWIANAVKASDNVEAVVNNLFSDMISYNHINDKQIDDIKELDFNIMNEIIKKIDFNNIAEVRIIPNKD